jgi:ATP/maltotriose-dependent transcriptional regulator MalT
MAAATRQAAARDETIRSRRRGKARLKDVSFGLEHDTEVNKAQAVEVAERLLLAIEGSQWDQAEALAAQEITVLRRLVTGQGARARPVPGLTKAELRLLPLLATHLSLPKIGAELCLSPNTVKSQAISIYRKLGVSSRGDAVNRAKKQGFLDAIVADMRQASRARRVADRGVKTGTSRALTDNPVLAIDLECPGH